MEEDTKQIVRDRAAAYFASEEFEDYYDKLHAPLWLLLPVAFIAPLTIVGWSVGMAAWKKLRHGDYQSSRLRERYARLGREGKCFMAHVVIANQILKYEEKASAPALVIGNLDDLGVNRIMEMRGFLADLALIGAEKPEHAATAKLLEDVDYTFQRRRRIPPEIAGDLEVFAFDLEIIGKYLPTATLKIEIIPCLAEPGNRGLICMIPAHLFPSANASTPQGAAKPSSTAGPPPVPAQASPDASPPPVPDHPAGVPPEPTNQVPIRSEAGRDTSAARYLTHTVLPHYFQTEREKIFTLMLSEKVNEFINQTTFDLASQYSLHVPSQMTQVERFRYGDFVAILLLFGSTQFEGESECALLLLGPLHGNHSPNLATLTYKYFVLELTADPVDGHYTKIVDLSHQEYFDMLLGCERNPMSLVDTVCNYVLKIPPPAD
ncbi:MAG: hypothetical protein AAGK14_09605 [Verrucomicrobiota bacterium]